jgi:hypothetical protein
LAEGAHSCTMQYTSPKWRRLQIPEKFNIASTYFFKIVTKESLKSGI